MMRRLIHAVIALGILFVGYWGGQHNILRVIPAAAQDDCQSFPQTGKSVCGLFLNYWRSHGGLAQQGYPVSDVFWETSAIDGNLYQVQYFERAVFERHPEYAGTANEVLLSLLGREKFDHQYPAGLPSGETPLRKGQTVTLAGTTPSTTFRVVIDDIVKRAELPKSTGCERVRARESFVIVLMQIQNVSEQASGIRIPRLRDESGREFFEVDDGCPTQGAERLFNRKPGFTEVQPGAEESILIVYDVTVPSVGDFILVPAN